MTIVVNIKGRPLDCFDVYIGRPMAYAKDRRVRLGSPWCNPHRIGTGLSSADAVKEFERYLREWIRREPEVVQELLKLKGQRLGCWCKPAPCHGDVLVRLIGELEAS